MLKLLGSACILGGGILARYVQAAERRREMDTLSDLLWALRRMAEEIRMAEQFLAGRTPQRVEAVCCGEDVLRMKEQVRAVKVRESVLGYMEDLVALTRQEPRFVLGASPRALLALLRASQGKAFLLGRDYVKPDDVKAVARQVLLHRLTLSSEARVQKADGGAVLQSLILKAKVPV